MKTLKLIRKRLKLSSYKMAKLLGMSIQRYQYLEEHGKGTDYKTLAKIRELSGLSWKAFGDLLEKE